MSVDVWVLGAGGQAREAEQLLRATGQDTEGRRLRFIGLVDEDDEAELVGRSGALVLGVGTPSLRHRLMSRFLAQERFIFPTLVHPRADVGDAAVLAAGVVVASGCVVTTDVQIGQGTALNPRVGVGHDSRLGRCCVVNPGANISGSILIGDEVLIGTGATILQGLSIGDGVVIGAGAVVTRDVPAGVTVVGVPARPVTTERRFNGSTQ